MEYRIAICDDSEADRQYVLSILQHWANQNHHLLDVHLFSSAESFLFHANQACDFDILLLDIEMGAMDGVQMAKTIRQKSDAVQIVFITGYADYIAEGYEVSALHYLMKPVKEAKLFSVLDRAVQMLNKQEAALLLPVDGQTVRIPVSQIQVVEAFAHSVSIVTPSCTWSVRMSISDIEKQLGDGFVRCHRSYLVGLRHVASLSKTDVTLDNGRIVPMSRSAAQQMHRAFISYYAGDKDETV